jgi:serine/threonine protein kinase
MEKIGAGGMGEVYRARDTRLERDVAVKVLPPRLADDATSLARFEPEGKAIAALSVNPVDITPDGLKYMYICIRVTSDLFIVGGLR